MIVSILWREIANDKPDDELTVLLAVPGEDDPLMGYCDGDKWYSTESGLMDIAPLYWAHLPEVPEMKLPKKKKGQ